MDRHRPSRVGFTLVEVLTAILIIGILIAILVPTVASAFRRAKEAQVAAELNNLATALADFKSKFGDYPPSRILLCEGGYNAFLALPIASQAIPGPSGNGASVTDITYGQLAQRSALALTKFWPRADFFGPPPNNPNPAYGQYHDFNGDGSYGNLQPNTGYYILSGAECLTFFLGGLSAFTTDPTTNSTYVSGLTGFSRSPIRPFVNVQGSASRTVPLYEFANSRLKDIDGDHIPTYFDPLGNSTSDAIPYAYFAPYGTNGYDPNDINDNGHSLNGATYTGNNEQDESLTSFAIMRQFSVSYQGTTVISSAPNPYTSAVPVGASTGTNYFNPNSFQLFTAGADRLWGLGGLYQPNANSGTRLPLPPAELTGYTNLDPTADAAIRDRERDNITNFSGGRLD